MFSRSRRYKFFRRGVPLSDEGDLLALSRFHEKKILSEKAELSKFRGKWFQFRPHYLCLEKRARICLPYGLINARRPLDQCFHGSWFVCSCRILSKYSGIDVFNFVFHIGIWKGLKPWRLVATRERMRVRARRYGVWRDFTAGPGMYKIILHKAHLAAFGRMQC